MELKPILLDTNAYTALTRNVADAIEIIKYTPSVYLNSVILGELLAGFAAGSKESENKVRLNYFLEIDKVKCLPIEPVTSEFYASVYRDLRPKGRPIPITEICDRKVGPFQQMICGLRQQHCSKTWLYLAMISIFRRLKV